MDIGEKILQALRMKEITQKELALKLGIPLSTLSGYITGRYIPEYIRFREIAVALRISSDFLLGIDSETALSDDETLIIIKYRKLDDIKKKEAMKYFKFLEM